MKKYILLSVFSIHLTVSLSQTKGLKIPEGWRVPNEYDIKDGWLENETANINAYYFKNDFDKNGFLDEAWILLRKDNTKFGIWILLNDSSRQINYLIAEVSMSDIKPQNIGISIAKAGTFQTACGKGYFECKPGDPSEIEIKTPQLWYSPFQSGPGFVIMWNEKEKIFRSYQMSD